MAWARRHCSRCAAWGIGTATKVRVGSREENAAVEQAGGSPSPLRVRVLWSTPGRVLSPVRFPRCSSEVAPWEPSDRRHPPRLRACGGGPSEGARLRCGLDTAISPAESPVGSSARAQSLRWQTAGLLHSWRFSTPIGGRPPCRCRGGVARRRITLNPAPAGRHPRGPRRPVDSWDGRDPDRERNDWALQCGEPVSGSG